MAKHHPLFINNKRDARRHLDDIGVDDGAYPFLIPKAVQRCIKLAAIPCRAANIIKQEMLSKGGEAAVSGQALYGDGETDVLLMGTLKQYGLLAKKLRLQPLGLSQVADRIEEILTNLEPAARRLSLCHGKSLLLGQQTVIMGILNRTPDSFYDGGRFGQLEQAVGHACEMWENGAGIIDIGGVSSRPGAELADEEEEMQRVLPLVKRLAAEDMIISIDTFRGTVAKACLEAGAHLINSIGGPDLDPTLIPIVVESRAPLVLMHNRLQINLGQPYQDLIADISGELHIKVKDCIAAGLNPEQIIIDPGLGFGKTAAENRLLVKHLSAFKGLGRPILLGGSRKRFIGQTLNLEVDQRLEGSLAVLAIGILNGADIIRVHDVKESWRTASMIDAIRNENG